MTAYRGARVARLALLSAAFVAAGGCGKKKEGGAGGGRGGGPAIAVRVATVTRMDAPITVTASGVAEPMQTVAVQSQVSGVLQQVTFTEGQPVEAGQVLFRIDPRPLIAQVAQARAALARDAAQAEAARRNDERYQTLVRQDYVAREEADQVHAAALAAAATVEADRAMLNAAEVNLSYATIRAPIAGRTGRLLVRAGNLVGPSTGPLVVINQLRPVLVRFPILSQDLPTLQAAVAAHPLNVTAVLSDSSRVTETGRLSFLDNSVDSLTGTVTGKAVFENRSGALWPGQLAFLTVEVGITRNALAVPSAAVLTGQQGSYVYVVDRQRNVAQSRDVVAGRTVGDLTIVTSGLDEGETVVTDGQSRLKTGAKVAIQGAGGRDGGGADGSAGGAGDAAASGEGAPSRGASVAAGTTGGSGGSGSPPGGTPAAGVDVRASASGNAPAGSGAQAGSSARTAPARTGGGAAAAGASSPTTTPTGARSGTGNGTASPVPNPAASSGAGRGAAGAAGGTAAPASGSTPAGAGARP